MLNYFDNLTHNVDLTTYNEFIESLKPHAGSTWDNKTEKMKTLKRYISSMLERFQKRRCAYCGLEYTATGYTNIEHIAPKNKYPQFMFESKNLVAACPRCNGFEKKGTLDTVEFLSAIYDECTFIIVHPYFDNPEDHFEFINGESGIIIRHKTTKGAKSIEIFKLDDTWMLEQRAKLFISLKTKKPERKRQIDSILAAMH
ncbi:uncharacterized protein (TIGR02646 family) [Hydrogenoanaerobacterium saccharovorans]|uniref:TIGR02646 family protein n=1 Tax=Hydrogenoanaerobacterium saccharovorans TaxID=474960 RepID=A0A1H8B0T9_9FIRM|nr:retron system putative HNH endonuclease [Hydrogenoanaerobacterium saccharovorans]RPF47681.1 uncharacterized protein (TIGR02646 family) [Hydrogenoanaerobacterium saccharovorans]SEM75718.1 TIGR02646 family protein [Hydrogenoanaerobacterium saccharovorans]